jgi:predicted NACHT family NTPase
MSFHLLLDGLDEVAAKHHGACIEIINHIREAHGPVNVVVCSRTADYEQLTNRLRLTGAIVIQPLCEEQINAYLEVGGRPLLVLGDP